MPRSWLALPSACVAIALAAGLAACGGGGDEVELSERAQQGREVADRAGCSACHGGPGGGATVGPSWVGSWGTSVELDDGSAVPFDRAYVVQSVREPELHRRSGDWLRMPSFGDDQVTDDELEDLVVYLEELGTSR